MLKNQYIQQNSIWLIVLLVLISSCYSIDKPVYQKHSLSKKGMVVSANKLATEAGLEIMKQGGNAVDAAIAVHFALAVTHPRAGNIGGGGFALFRDSNHVVKSLDFREKAPAQAGREMFLDEEGDYIPESSLKGPLAAGVPGSVAGMWKMYKELDPNLSWEDLLKPAIKLAADGFPISEAEAKRMNEFQKSFNLYNDASCPFIRKSQWKEGDLLIQARLANTLQIIASQGGEAFYNGEIAGTFVNRYSEKGGLITAKDLAAYRAVWRKPIHGTYKKYEFFSMGPPSSGGIAILQILKMIEDFSLEQSNPHAPYNIHLITEASKAAFEDRAIWLGDPDYKVIPVDKLLSSDWLSEKMKAYNPEKAKLIGVNQEGKQIESFETTHFTVADNEGRCIAITSTLNSNYGNLVWLPELGFFLNNQMDDFSVRPGQSNQYGLLSSEANEIEAGKRMLSSMSPTFITKNKEMVLALGAPGGPTIISSVLQVILNVIEYDLELSEAVNLPRYHHQWVPDELLMEGSLVESPAAKVLSAKGHKIIKAKSFGSINAIKRFDSGMFEAVADRRDESHAQGL